MTAKIEWCKWCDQEHATDFLCEQAFSALQDIANLGADARPLQHFPPNATLDDFGIDPETVEFIGGIGFNGGAIEIDGKWWVMIALLTEDTEGNNNPVRVMVTPVEGFERMRDWTMQVFD